MLFLLASSDTFAQETLDADLVVGMTASPTTGLVTGEFVDIWITVTNKGPARVDGLSLESSTFFDEFGQPLTSTTSLWLAVLFAATAMFALCARPRCDSMSARARKRKF